MVGEDHPKACTGRRLLHLGRAVRLPPSERLRAKPIVLDPRAPVPLTRADGRAAERGGLLAIDCSWNRVAARGTLPRVPGADGGGPHRRLPILIAANPQHFGRVAELNTVEALSAALYVLGQPGAAARLLDGFRGGEGFVAINRERLDRYAAAGSPAELTRAEAELFGGP